MHDIGFDLPLQRWFDFKIPSTSIKKDFIHSSLLQDPYLPIHPADKIIYLGAKASHTVITKMKHGKNIEVLNLRFDTKESRFEIEVEKEKGYWLLELLEKLSIKKENKIFSYAKLKEEYEKHFDDFELFWHSKAIDKLRANGLLVL